MKSAASIALDSRELQFLGNAFDEAWTLIAPTVPQAVVESTKLRLATLLMALNQSACLDMEELVDAALRALHGDGPRAVTAPASFSQQAHMSDAGPAELVPA